MPALFQFTRARFLLLLAVVCASACDGRTGDTRPDVTVSVAITAGPSPLVIDFSSIVSGGVGRKTYSWDFGDGTTSSATDPTHVFTELGTYVTILRVTDEAGATSASGVQIAVTEPADKPPMVVAAIVAGECAIPNVTRVELDASLSTDPEDRPLTYRWTMMFAPLASTVSFNNANVANPSFVPDAEGVYLVRVAISDGVNIAGSELLAIVATRATNISIVSGNQQSAAVVTEVVGELVAAVTNSCGLAMDNVAVRWQAINGRPLFGVSSTNIAGLSINRITTGKRAAEVSVLATLPDNADQVTFTLTASPGPAARLVMNLGGANLPVSATSQPLTFHVTDSFGNPINSEVTFDLAFDPVGSPSSSARFDDCTTGDKTKTGVTTTAGVATVAVCSTSLEDAFVQISNTTPTLATAGYVRLFADDMEIADNSYTQFQFGPLPDENPWQHGPPSWPTGIEAFSGTRLRGTVLDGDVRESPFDGNPLRSILSRQLDLTYPGSVLSAELSFQQFVDLGELGPFDCQSHATLRIGSINGLVAQPTNMLYDVSGCRSAGFLRSTSDWEQVRFDLTGQGGALTSLHWSLNASASAIGSGWYIDDVLVTALVTNPRLRFVAGPPTELVLTEIADGSTESCQPAAVYGRLSDELGNPTTEGGVVISLSSDSGSAIFATATLGSNFIGGTTASIETVDGEFALTVVNASTTSETINVTAQAAGQASAAVVALRFQDVSTEDAFAGSCNDGVDSDCDGDVDCDDSDCTTNIACVCQAPYFVNNGRCARTYFLTVADWIGPQTDCGLGHYHSCDSLPYGFRFDDLPQLGMATVTAIDIETFSGVDCAGPSSRSVTVNQVPATTFIFMGDGCICSPVPNLQVVPTVNAAGLAAYVVGGSNEIEIANPTSCEGFSENPDFDGGLWAVTVTY